MSFRNGDVTLAGTLSIPAGPVRRWPVAVFVSGDGAQDRDSGSLFPLLADSLVARGVAVLRHDDRGAARSSIPAGPPSYRALLGDTRAAIAFARKRSEIDPRHVLLVGHSEGAKTCAVLAAEDSTIAGIAMLAGATVVSIDTLLQEQALLNSGGPAVRLMLTMTAAKAGKRAQGPTDLADWMREHLELAPRTVLPKVRCPVLILQGEADVLVRAHHAQEAAALIAGNGNGRVTLRTFPGLSHVFTRAGPRTELAAGAAGTDPAVAQALAEWVATNVRGSP